jgi:hypothetical protein
MRRCFLTAGLILTVLTPPAQAGADAAPGAAPPTENVTVTDHAMLDNPDGKGDPDAISCRKPQQLPGSRFMAPPVCKSNREWAQIRTDGNDLSPDGRTIVQSEKARTLNSAACRPPAPVGANRMATFDFNSACNRY